MIRKDRSHGFDAFRSFIPSSVVSCFPPDLRIGAVLCHDVAVDGRGAYLTFAALLVGAVGLYALVGLLFAIAFVLAGVNRVDPVAREGTWGFRLIIVPGVVAFWPLLATRWVSGRPPAAERNAHRDRARAAGR